jgi:hypothetical protein
MTVSIGWATADQLTPDLAEMLRYEEDRIREVGFPPPETLEAIHLDVDDGVVLSVVRDPDLGPLSANLASGLSERPASPEGAARLGRRLVHWTTPERLSEVFLAHYQETQAASGPDPAQPGRFSVLGLPCVDIIVVIDETEGSVLAERWATGWRPDGWDSRTKHKP